MGPRYSAIGAAQVLVKRGAKSLDHRVAGRRRGVLRPGVGKVAPAAGIPFKSFPTKLPVTDANSAVLQLVQAAGPGGGVILNFTPDTAPALHEGGDRPGPRRQGASGARSTPIANTFMAAQFPQFDRKMFINRSSACSTRRRARTPG